MAPRLLIGNYGGIGRVRFAKAGQDVTANLSNEQLVFDSAWPEILNIHSMSRDTGSQTPSKLTSGSNDRYYVQFGFPSLPFAPLALAWAFQDNFPMQDSTGNTKYSRVYWPAPVTVTNGTIRITSPATTNGAYKYAYYVFNKPLFGADPREADNGGANGILIGNHPSRGYGLFASRRGANVLTCGDDDLTLSTSKPVLQVRESGTVGTGGLDVAGWITGTFYTSQNYPNYPPIIIRGSDYAWGDPVVWRQSLVRYAEFAWVSSNSVRFRMKGGSQDNLRWTILDYDMDYVTGPDNASTPRVLVNSNGLLVSKKNVDVRTAGEGDLLLRTDRSVLHVSHRQQFFSPSASANSGEIPLNTNTSGPPLTFFGFQFNGENYCRVTGLDLNAYVTDWYPTSTTAPSTGGQARAAHGNKVIYSFPSGQLGQGYWITAIDHS